MNLSLVKNNNVTSKPFINLQQLYEHEFSTVTGYKTNQDGLYNQEEIISHWSEIFDIYILYNEKRPIGFTVVNLKSMLTNDNNTRDIAEFYVLPDSRSNGTGKWMAHEIFKKYPGKWEIRQLPGLKVRDFWIKSISEFTKNNFVDIEVKDQFWEGSIQRFKSIS